MDKSFLKIIDTTYRLLDFFPDSDPLKNKAKEKTLSILENLTLLSKTEGWVSLKKERISIQLFGDIEVLEAYLKIARYQGWMDNMNFLILNREYERIKNSINLPQGSIMSSLEIITPPASSSYVSTGDMSMKMEKQFSLSSNQADHTALSERQKKILEILNNKGKVQVADIIKTIPDITKRTIRRDLIEMIKVGIIERGGEWNKAFYQLK